MNRASGLVALLILLAACAPQRRQTQFSKNKEIESGQIYTEEQLRAALGPDRYDILIAGIGQANLNLLSYAIGTSNMAQLINAIPTPGKLVALMSTSANSPKLTAVQVLDLLNKVDDACQLAGTMGNDTLMKVANLINAVSLSGMDGLKNIVHGVSIQSSDPNGVPYSNDAMARLGLLLSLVNENASAMPTLVNDISSPGGVYSPEGTARLLRLINNTFDMRDIAIVVNQTNSLSNITGVIAGLTSNIYCSKAQYAAKGTCETNGGVWTNNSCPAFPAMVTRADCQTAGGTWTPDGVENMLRILNESDKTCSVTAHNPNGTACLGAGATWSSKVAKLPVVINHITNVPNLNQIVNLLSNDAKKPGDAGNTFDGVDSLVATINNLWVAAAPFNDADAYGLNGIKRLAYFVNNLDTVAAASNDETFDAGSDCANGLFDNRLNWAFSNNNATTAAPWFGKAFRSTNAAAQAGVCSITNDTTAAVDATQTQSAELVANLVVAGNIEFYHRETLSAGENVKFFVDDTLTATWTASTAAFTLQSYAVTTGIHRFRWEIFRNVGSTSQVYIDTVTLPGEKGQPRTAAEKTAIMLNNIYIAASITNIAEIMNTVTVTSTPAGCWTAPTFNCTPTYDNGLDALITTINKAEYPVAITDVPRLATTVNTINNVPIMVSILNNLTTTDATRQLLAMLDFVQTPSTIPNLINALTGDAGAKVGVILNNNNAAGTINLLRVIADTGAGGVPVAETANFINGLNTTSHVSVILNKLMLTANVKVAGSVIVGASPTGGQKVAQFFNQVITKGQAAPAQNCSSGTTSDFCIKNHLVRLVNDVAASSGGPTVIAEIVSGMRPDTGPGGLTGVVRMTDILYDLKQMDAASIYNNGLLNTATDHYGRLTTLIADMGGASAGVYTARIVNEINQPYLVARVSDLIKTINRTRYVSRLLSEMSSVDLMLQLLNDANTNMANIKMVVNGQGNLAYGTDTSAADLPAFYTSPSQTGHKPVRTTTYTTAGSDLDTLGRLIQLINGVTGGITNVVTLINVIADLKFIAAVNGMAAPNSMPTPYNPDAAGGRNYGYGLINEADQTNYISNLMNGVANLDLLLTIINGPGSCSDATKNSRSTCLAAAATWTEGNMGVCSGVAVTSISNANPAVVTKTAHSFANGAEVSFTTTGALPAPLTTSDIYFVVGAAANTFNLSLTPGGAAIATTSAGSGTHTVWGHKTQAACSAGGGTWTANSPIAANSAQYLKLTNLINDVAGSTRQGTGAKAVGDVSILSSLINDLGNTPTGPQTLANQARIITVLNDVVYCGINPANDRNIANNVAAGNPGGPNCSVAAYGNEVSCVGAGATWRNGPADATAANRHVLACNQPISYAYSKTADFYDPRPRLTNAVLSVDTAYPLSIVIGQVSATKKTVRILNGARRSNTVLRMVNLLPGEATRDLVNTVNLSQIYPAMDYLVNNLSGDEDTAAEAFSSLVFWGNSIGQGASRTGTRMDFKAVGPKRLGGVLNTESGSYLESLMSKFGWRTVIPLLMCGLSPSGVNTLDSYSGYDQAPDWVTSGTAVNSNATGNTCGTANAEKCMYIPGRLGTVLFKQKEVMTTSGSCSNATYKTRSSCQFNSGIWDPDTGSATWTFGVTTATDVANCKAYHDEQATVTILLSVSRQVDWVVWAGVNVVISSPAGIAGAWGILKGKGIIGSNVSDIDFPPPVGTGYTCTSGVSGDNTNEYACVDNGMKDDDGPDNIAGNDDDNVSLYRWGNQCSIPQRGGTNCNANYTTCETTCQGRWIPNKDWPTHRVNPFAGGDPIQ